MTETATLLLMPDGDRPEVADFAAGDVFATFEAAIRAAHQGAGPKEAMVPWVLFGRKIMEPDQVMGTNTPPPPLERLKDTQLGDRLDEDLEDTFPASDPPARSEP